MQALRFKLQLFEDGRLIKEEMSDLYQFESPLAAANAVVRFNATATRTRARLDQQAEEAQDIRLPRYDVGYGPKTCVVIAGCEEVKPVD